MVYWCENDIMIRCDVIMIMWLKTRQWWWCKMMWNDIVMWYDVYDENIYKTKIEINVGQALTPKLQKFGLY